MKIAFIMSTLNNGGSERVCSLLASEWQKNYNEVVIILTHKYAKERGMYDLNKDVKIFCLSEKKDLSFFKKILMIKKILKQERIKIVVSFFETSNLLSLLSTAFTKIKRVCSERNYPILFPKNKLLKIVRSITFNFSHHVVFQTKDAQKCFSKHIQKKSSVIPNPLKLDIFSTIRNKNNINTNKIVAVGRLFPQKNYLFLVESFAIYHNMYPNTILEIYGSGPEEQKIINLINKHELNNCVLIKGFTSKIEKEICDAKFFCMVSKFEGMPNALLEAEAIGLPIVCTDFPSAAVHDLIEEKYNGLIAKENSTPKEFANKMIEMEKNIDFFIKNAMEFKNSMSQIYGIDVVSNKWLNLFERLLND